LTSVPAAELSPAFVLHARRYGDTSLLVELFGVDSGRSACIAKGAAKTQLLQPFQPLLVALRGRGEVQTLAAAEPAGARIALLGRTLYCGFYLNELLMKLTARGDPSPEVYRLYAQTITAMGQGQEMEGLLRSFEVGLVERLGLGLVLDHDSDGEPLDLQAHYRYDMDRGPERASADSEGHYPGAMFRALRTGQFDPPELQRHARVFMRRVLDHHLEGRPIRSRELFR
jgi:DNA repair protein RecO (recombination protein O)